MIPYGFPSLELAHIWNITAGFYIPGAMTTW